MNSKSMLALSMLSMAGISACGDSAKKGAKAAAPAPEVKVVGQAGGLNLNGRYKLVSISCDDLAQPLNSEVKDSFRLDIGDTSLNFHLDGTDPGTGNKCAIDQQSQILELNYESALVKTKNVKSVANCVDARGTKLPEQNLADPSDADKTQEVNFRKVNDRQLEIKDKLDEVDPMTGCEAGKTLSTLLERE